MGCTDGCLRVLTPIKLKDIDISFLDFQECIKKEIPFLAGFDKCDSRRLFQKHRTYKITSRGNIIDGDLVTDFTNNTEMLKNYIYEKTDLSV